MFLYTSMCVYKVYIYIYIYIYTLSSVSILKYKSTGAVIGISPPC